MIAVSGSVCLWVCVSVCVCLCVCVRVCVCSVSLSLSLSPGSVYSLPSKVSERIFVKDRVKEKETEDQGRCPPQKFPVKGDFDA